MPIGTFAIHYPRKMLHYFDKAIAEQQEDMLKALEGLTADDKIPSRKPKFHARIYNLPVSSELTKGTLPRACDIGRFVSVRGTVVRAGLAKMLEVQCYASFLLTTTKVEKVLQVRNVPFGVRKGSRFVKQRPISSSCQVRIWNHSCLYFAKIYSSASPRNRMSRLPRNQDTRADARPWSWLHPAFDICHSDGRFGRFFEARWRCYYKWWGNDIKPSLSYKPGYEAMEATLSRRAMWRRDSPSGEPCSNQQWTKVRNRNDKRDGQRVSSLLEETQE